MDCRPAILLDERLTYRHLTSRRCEMADHSVNGYFVALPETTLDSDEWRSFTASTRCVYETMLLKYKRKGGDGRVTWRQDELAKVSGFSLNTIKRSISDLIEEKWITVWEPGGRWLDGTTYSMSSLYADGKE